ncbi:MAG: RsmG family class I SAM-dependent methyltransferase, partial [Chloroflexota bacterium]
MNRLSSAVKQLLGFDLTPAQLAAFRIYAAGLAAWNEKFNLTAIKSPADVEIKHFADSLSCLPAIRNTQHATRASLIDIGTGA